MNTNPHTTPLNTTPHPSIDFSELFPSIPAAKIQELLEEHSPEDLKALLELWAEVSTEEPVPEPVAEPTEEASNPDCWARAWAGLNKRLQREMAELQAQHQTEPVELSETPESSEVPELVDEILLPEIPEPDDEEDDANLRYLPAEEMRAELRTSQAPVLVDQSEQVVPVVTPAVTPAPEPEKGTEKRLHSVHGIHLDSLPDQFSSLPQKPTLRGELEEVLSESSEDTQQQLWALRLLVAELEAREFTESKKENPDYKPKKWSRKQLLQLNESMSIRYGVHAEWKRVQRRKGLTSEQLNKEMYADIESLKREREQERKERGETRKYRWKDEHSAVDVLLAGADLLMQGETVTAPKAAGAIGYRSKEEQEWIATRKVSAAIMKDDTSKPIGKNGKQPKKRVPLLERLLKHSAYIQYQEQNGKEFNVSLFSGRTLSNALKLQTEMLRPPIEAAVENQKAKAQESKTEELRELVCNGMTRDELIMHLHGQGASTRRIESELKLLDDAVKPVGKTQIDRIIKQCTAC